MTAAPEGRALAGEVVGRGVVDDLDAAYAEIRREPYKFTWAGREWRLVHYAELDYEFQAKIEGAASMTFDDLQELFKQALGEQQSQDWSTVTRPTAMLQMLFQRWVEHSGAKPGEDSASSGSSGSTGRSSRRTSGGSTGSGSPKRSTAKRAPRKAVSPPAS